MTPEEFRRPGHQVVGWFADYCERLFGYFPSNGEVASVLGDYLSTGLGVLGLPWQSSPALAEVEEVTTDWTRQMAVCRSHGAASSSKRDRAERCWRCFVHASRASKACNGACAATSRTPGD